MYTTPHNFLLVEFIIRKYAIDVDVMQYFGIILIVYY